MNKKLFIAFCAIVAVIAFCAWFFMRTPRVSVTDPSDVFPVQVFPVSVGPVRSSPVASTSAVVVDSPAAACPDGSVFDQNDCVTKIAQKAQDQSLCSSVQGALAKASCIRSIKGPVVGQIFAQPKNTYDSFMKSYVASSVPSTPADVLVEPVRDQGLMPQKSPSSSVRYNDTIQAFWERSSKEAVLAVYTVFPYQSRPGDEVSIQGSGFALDATNVVHIGGTEVSGVTSSDGMNLSVVIPSSVSMGTNEVWVTNGRGSARSPERPIFAVVSANPIPAPRITAVSPVNPSSSDTITLSGEHLEGLKGVYTTFGQSGAGTSLSFKVSDLERSWLVLKDGAYKGKKIPLYVYVQTEGGLSKDPFIFDVQY